MPAVERNGRIKILQNRGHSNSISLFLAEWIGTEGRDSCGKYVSKGDTKGAKAPRADRPRKASACSGKKRPY
ncbi:hypothetical protein [Peribacillus simplex]|uniref:hypothetical protein n=1 Tax=Peribacillus simplex TaxID=1478 RepID=UPI003D2825C3